MSGSIPSPSSSASAASCAPASPTTAAPPDYDDWNLNGDILLWDDLLGRAIELSSMGIRVDAAALDRQLKTAGCDDRRELPFHKMLLEGQLPLTMGGGIGQSRLCMLLLGKAHIERSRYPPGTTRPSRPAMTPASFCCESVQ